MLATHAGFSASVQSFKSEKKKIHSVMVLFVRNHKNKKSTLRSGGPSLGPALLSPPGPNTDFPSFWVNVWFMGDVGNMGQSDPKIHGSTKTYSSHWTWAVSLKLKPGPSQEV